VNSGVILYYSENGETGSLLSAKLGTIEIATERVDDFPRLLEQVQSGRFPVLLYRCDTVSDRLIQILSASSPADIRTKVIVNPCRGSVEDAVRIIKLGAIDFILSEGYDSRILESVLRAATQAGESTNTPDAVASPADESLPLLIGKSPAISEIRSAVSLIAKSQTTVLLTGESGTGKDVVAHLIHQQSTRSAKPFYALNCASLPRDVIENELFGHEKGAFTGALPKKAGCFESANGGTLFFDEIAEMSLDTQAKLLRAIETQKFRRLGGKDEVTVDVRMIAATNKNVTAALRTKELREDLYYRLSVIELYIPPLRERKEDVLPIVEHFLAIFTRKYAKPELRFSEESLHLLTGYEWPGNVRELRNVVERALVISPETVISPRYLPERLRSPIVTEPQINIRIGSSTQEAEKILILQTLASAGNNKAKTARILGMSRKTLHNKLLSFSQSEV
jgi:DNA-binding NtrC family response regulator